MKSNTGILSKVLGISRCALSDQTVYSNRDGRGNRLTEQESIYLNCWGNLDSVRDGLLNHGTRAATT